jgi:two-component system, chemotaxis family, chemotaxis protein CheY
MRPLLAWAELKRRQWGGAACGAPRHAVRRRPFSGGGAPPYHAAARELGITNVRAAVRCRTWLLPRLISCWPGAVPDAQAEPAGGQPRLVLVVEDDPGIREVLAEVLRDEGLGVAEAGNGAEALDLLSARPAALILLDMRMPVMNGWQFAAAYRALPGPHAPIVVISAAVDARRWCEEIQGDGYLAKPFEIDAVLHEVTRLAA